MPPIGVLLMAYGGPESLDEVEPYLMDVRGGRPTSAETIREVRERYRRIGGRSPILERTRAQAEALEGALSRGGADAAAAAPRPFRTFVGMRHWRPYIQDTLARMAAEGITRAVGLVMTPQYSRLSVGAYERKVEEARSPVEVALIERWHLLPGYLDAVVDRVREALARFPAGARGRLPILFTAHSLPRRILEWGDPYPRELDETVAAIRERLDRSPGAAGAPGPSPADAARGNPRRCHLAYQSAALTPDPWLGPDAGELIERLAREGEKHLLIAPIGFLCEHVEILYDVDIALKEQAARLGVHLERIEMLNTSPPLIAGLADLVRARAAERGWA